LNNYKALYRYEGYSSCRNKIDGSHTIFLSLGFGVFAKQNIRIDKDIEIDKNYVFETSKPKSFNSNLWGATIVEDEWKRKYRYKCFIKKIYDGDTVTKAVIDLGFDTIIHARLRLYGINTPELRKPTLQSGREARDRLRELILDKNVIIETDKDKKGKYGRYLATIYCDDKNINQLMVNEGHAVEYMV
jgi:micrococcal nuclease